MQSGLFGTGDFFGTRQRSVPTDAACYPDAGGNGTALDSRVSADCRRHHADVDAFRGKPDIRHVIAQASNPAYAVEPQRRACERQEAKLEKAATICHGSCDMSQLWNDSR